MTIGAMNRSARLGWSRRISVVTRRTRARSRRALMPRPPASPAKWRKAASRSSVPASARSSAPVPRAMTLPARTNRSSSHRSASSMTWLETTIVVPASASARKWVQNWTRRSGSTPTVGSSRNRTVGRWTSAQASERRRRWPPDERAGDGLRAVREVDERERLVDRRARVRPVRGGEEPRVLAGGQRRVDAVALGHVADPGEDAAVGHPHAEDLGVPLAGVGHPREQPDQRGLARAVGAEEPVDAARGELERDPVHGRRPARTA